MAVSSRPPVGPLSTNRIQDFAGSPGWVEGASARALAERYVTISSATGTVKQRRRANGGRYGFIGPPGAVTHSAGQKSIPPSPRGGTSGNGAGICNYGR